MSKSITYLLAFAASSSLLLAQDKPAGGWSAKAGSGLTYDSDAFSLKWSNRLQVHWVLTDNDNNAPPDSSNFTVRRARTNLTGHVFNKNVTYALIVDGTDVGANGNIKQAWGQWNFIANDDGAIGLRVGQAKTQFGLEATWTSAGLWFVERSIASRTFADSFSRGAWVNGMLMKDRPIRFTVGAMNTDVSRVAGTTDVGEETSNTDNELSYVMAANFDPLGDFHDGKQTRESRRQGDWRTDDTSVKGTVGVGIGLSNGNAGGAGTADIESTSLNLNTAWTVARFNFLGEFFTRTDDIQGGAADEEEPAGFAVSAGYLLEKSGDSAIQWGFGFRFSAVEFDEGAVGSGVDFLTSPVGGNNIPALADGDLSEITAVVNAFYHGHQCKTQLEFTLQDVEPTGGADFTNQIIRIAFQIEF